MKKEDTSKRFKEYGKIVISVILAIISLSGYIYWLNLETDASKKLIGTPNYQPEYIKDTELGQITITLIIIVVICALIIYGIVVTLENRKYKTKDKKELQNQIEECKKELTKEKNKNNNPGSNNLLFRRFRTILSKKQFNKVINDDNYIKTLDDKLKKREKIVYGSIDYSPFFWHDKEGNKKTPNGIGYNILSKVFEISTLGITPYKYARHQGFNWESIFDSLIKKDFDVIITPMYETRTRIYKNVSFCIPLFYSDIGIYIREDKYIDDDGNKLSLKFYDEAIEYLKKHTNKKAASLPGELSEVIAKKKKFDIDEYDKSNINLVYEEENFELLLEQVMAGEKDFVFMEVFKAEQIIKKYKPKNDTKFKELKLINILKFNQLVYPVSFVVRKEDTVLRNFINLRIAELRENRKLLKIIEDEAKKIGIGTNEVRERFIQTYDFSIIDEKYSRNRVLFSQLIKDEYEILDKVYGNYTEFQKENIEKYITEFISKNGSNLKILEIGCGTGITTEIILKTNDDITVTAIDSDPQMIEITKNKLNKYVEKKKLIIINSDALHYLRDVNEFSSEINKFDIIISAFTIHNFDKVYRRRLLGEIIKSMTEKSIFLNIDKYAPDDDIKRVEALSHRLKRYQEEINNYPKFKDKPELSKELLKEWVNHYIEDQYENKVMKVNETKELMQELKYEILEYNESGELEMMAILKAKKRLEKDKE